MLRARGFKLATVVLECIHHNVGKGLGPKEIYDALIVICQASTYYVPKTRYIVCSDSVTSRCIRDTSYAAVKGLMT